MGNDVCKRRRFVDTRPLVGNFRSEHNGDLLVGGWSFAEDNPEETGGNEDEAFRDHVAGVVPRFLEGFDRAGYVDGWAGVDGATPNTRPVIDAPGDTPEGRSSPRASTVVAR